jgi:pimeloyl-ACP methyl ester carboxylesterase
VRLRRIVTSFALVLLASVVSGVPSAAARTDTTDKPIYLVHGHAGGSGTDCAQWKTLRDAFRAWGGTGAFKTVAFYYRDKHCNTNIALSGSPARRHRVVDRRAHMKGSHTSDAPIAHLAYHLAWNIYDAYSRRGRPVDVIGHSMGGLIIRYAVAATQRHEFDFPPFLLVEDVVTMGTPHGGLRGVIPQDISEEVNEMTPGSKLLKYLTRNAWNPQARGGTDWLTMGSAADDTVAPDSAAATYPRRIPVSRYMGSAHKVWYTARDKIKHSDYYKLDSTQATASALESLAPGPFTLSGAALWPLRRAFDSLVSGDT